MIIVIDEKTETEKNRLQMMVLVPISDRPSVGQLWQDEKCNKCHRLNPVFTGFGTLWLLPISETKITAPWMPFSINEGLAKNCLQDIF